MSFYALPTILEHGFFEDGAIRSNMGGRATLPELQLEGVSVHRTVRHRLALVAALSSISLTAHDLRAGDLTIVTVTESGPDRDIPIGSAYYLTGTIDTTVTEVRPVFVRVGTKTLFGNTGASCQVFAAHVGKFKAAAGPSDTIQTPIVGRGRASDVWQGIGGFDASAPVFVGAAWKPADPAATTYKTLVPADDFFSATGEYCLFVYKTGQSKTARDQDIVKILSKFATDYSACTDTICRATAQSSRDGDLARIGATFDASTLKKVDDAVSAALAIRVGLETSLATIDAILLDWEKLDRPTPLDGFVKASTFDATRTFAKAPTLISTSKEDALARATVSLLVQHQALRASVLPGRGSVYFADDGKIGVGQVQIMADGRTIRVASDTDGKSSRVLATKTDELSFSADDVSLRDVLEVFRGRVRLDAGYVPVSDIRRDIAVLVAEPTKAPSDTIKTRLESLGKRTRLIAGVIEGALEAKGAASKGAPIANADLGTQSASLRELGTWIADLLVPCTAGQLSSWHLPPKCGNSNDPGDWPGYVSVSGAGAKLTRTSSTPPSILAGQIAVYEDRISAWPKAATDLASAITTSKTTPASPIAMTAHFDQSNWLFSYVTPVVGVGFLLSPSETFSLPYLGVQIHLVANPVDEPLWTKPNDILRAFALELGVATGNGPWGTGDRFSGWKDLPPVMLGIAVHPLPYTSASFGMAFLQRRSSVVKDEKSEAYLSSYAGLNVQVNIPDLIAGLKGRHSDTQK